MTPVHTARSASTAKAALRPLSPTTLPAGWVAAPQRYTPLRGSVGGSAATTSGPACTRPGRCARRSARRAARCPVVRAPRCARRPRRCRSSGRSARGRAGDLVAPLVPCAVGEVVRRVLHEGRHRVLARRSPWGRRRSGSTARRTPERQCRGCSPRSPPAWPPSARHRDRSPVRPLLVGHRRPAGESGQPTVHLHHGAGGPPRTEPVGEGGCDGVAEEATGDRGVGVGDDGPGSDHLSALEHHALARDDLGDGHAGGEHGPGLAAASPMANEMRPIPPST